MGYDATAPALTNKYQSIIFDRMNHYRGRATCDARQAFDKLCRGDDSQRQITDRDRKRYFEVN
jgi:hypothetical protein